MRIFMPRCALMLARVAASAWVGAAALFVATGVRQVTSQLFDVTTIDQLALLRFPLYYLCGFGLVGVAVAGTLASGAGLKSRERALILTLLGLALVLMTFDYLVIYSPLAVMITPPGQSRRDGFQELHHWSMVVNLIDLVLIGAAAMRLCWPSPNTVTASESP